MTFIQKLLFHFRGLSAIETCLQRRHGLKGAGRVDLFAIFASTPQNCFRSVGKKQACQGEATCLQQKVTWLLGAEKTHCIEVYIYRYCMILAFEVASQPSQNQLHLALTPCATAVCSAKSWSQGHPQYQQNQSDAEMGVIPLQRCEWIWTFDVVDGHGLLKTKCKNYVFHAVVHHLLGFRVSVPQVWGTCSSLPRNFGRRPMWGTCLTSFFEVDKLLPLSLHEVTRSSYVFDMDPF